MRCAATLQACLLEANVSLMVAEGVVSAFIDMLQTGDHDIVALFVALVVSPTWLLCSHYY